MSKTDHTSNSKAVFCSEFSEAMKRPLWTAEMRLEYGGKDGPNSRPVVFKRMGLTALEERTVPEKLLIATGLGKSETVDFRSPSLLQAYPGGDGPAVLNINLGDGSYEGNLAFPAAPPSTRTLPALIVTPAAGLWPDGEVDWEIEDTIALKMTLPHLRVVEGKIRAILLADGSPLAKAIGLGNGEVLGGLKVNQAGGGLAIALTAQGIEFEAGMPDPTADFSAGASADGTILVIVRFELDKRKSPVLRLVGSGDGGRLDAMEARLATIFAGLRADNSPVDVRFDVRPVVPAVRWPLVTAAKRLSIHATRGAANDPLRFVTWTVLLDQETISARVRSAHGADDAVASVTVRSAAMSRQAGPRRVTLQLNDNAAPAELTVKFQPVAPQTWTTESSMLPDSDVEIDLDPIATSLESAWAESRALSVGEALPSIFVPVRDGVLQLPVPPRIEPPQTAAPATGEPPDLQGRLIAKGPFGGDVKTRVLTLESAQRCAVTVAWAEARGKLAVTHVLLNAWQPSGQLNGYLFALDSSPTSEEAIPTLSAGAAATRDLPVEFGLKRISGRWWPAHFSQDAISWSLAFRFDAAGMPGSAMAWMRDAACGMVSIVPFTRVASSTAKSSSSRGLLPVLLKLPAAGKKSLILRAANNVICDASYEGDLAWASAGDLWHTFMPTLPGVEFRPEFHAGGSSTKLNSWAWSAKLRYGLPALDEFFGSTDLPRPRAANVDSGPVVTALHPVRLEDAWLRAYDKTSLGWAQSRFAINNWIDADGVASASEIVGLVEPLAWSAKLTVDTAVPAGWGGLLPGARLGSYTIGQKTYALAGALSGFGSEGSALNFVVDEQHRTMAPTPGDGNLHVLGMAASTFSLSDGLQRDSRGFAISSRASRKSGTTSAVVRDANLVPPASQASSWKAGDFALLTLPGVSKVKATLAGGGSLGFYARDFPVKALRTGTAVDYLFAGETNPVEAAPGETGRAFDPDSFGTSLHEWRLFQTEDQGGSRNRYELSWGPLSFTPLRLWNATVREDATGARLTQLSVIGRLNLSATQGPWAGTAGDAPFGPEEPYSQGDYFRLDVKGNRSTLTAVSIAEGDKGLIEAPDRADGLMTLNAMAREYRPGDVPSRPSGEIAIVLRLKPESGGAAELRARILGGDRVLKGKVTSFEENRLGVTCTAPQDIAKDPAAKATEIQIVLERPMGGDWTASIGVDVAFSLSNEKGQQLFSRSGDGTWHWLNLPGISQAPGEFQMSHSNGAVTCKLDARFEKAEPLLGFAARDFAVGGVLAHVFAAGQGWPVSLERDGFHFEMAGAEEDGHFQIHHAFCGPATELPRHRISLDCLWERKSIVHWPSIATVGADTASSEPPALEGGQLQFARLMEIPAAAERVPLLEHSLCIRLNAQPLDVDSLAWTKVNDVDAAGHAVERQVLCIATACRILAPVEHCLTAARDRRSLKWLSFDRVCLEPAAALAATDNAAPYVFAARYVHGKYRARSGAPGMKHPGIGVPKVSQSGLSDAHLLGAFAPLQGDMRPVVHGGSYTLFPGDSGSLSPQALGAVIPWLLDIQDGGPLANIRLDQSGSQKRTWRIASVDAIAGEGALSLDRTRKPPLAIATGSSSGRIGEVLGDALRGGKEALDRLRENAPVTQAYFELFGINAAIDMQAVPAREVPYFPQALLVLRAIWGDAARLDGQVMQALNVLSSGEVPDNGLHVKVFPPSAASVDRSPLQPVDVVALAAMRVLRLPNVTTVAIGNDPVAAFADGRSRAHLRDQVLRKLPDAAVTLLRSEAPGGKTRWNVLEMIPRAGDFGLPASVQPPEPLAASAALGWPSGSQTDVLPRTAAVAGHDVPIVSTSTGLAGRAGVLRFPAWAPSADDQEAIYLWLGSHVTFDRGPRAGKEQVLFRGPAARHLTPLPVRLRAPLSHVVSSVLERLTGEKGLPRVAPISPPHIESASVGHRPGEFHVWSAAIVLPAEGSGFDPVHSTYGRAAASGPVVARQLRAPRAPLLPQDRTLDLRRRTYVWAGDGSASPLAEMMLFKGTATALRLFDGSDECGYTIEASAGTPDGQSTGAEASVLPLSWSGVLRLRISGSRKDAARKRLTAFGLAPSENSGTSAAIRIGSISVPFASWKFMEESGNAVVIAFTMNLPETQQVIAEVRRSNIDVPLAFELQAVRTSSPPATGGDLGRRTEAVLRPGPPVNIALPLLRSPQGRATLPVKVSTVVFGDPAYDRQLGTPTRQSEPVALSTGKMFLALDRDEYHLDDTVHFIGGLLGKDNGFVLPPEKLCFSVEVLPKLARDGTVPPARPLWIALDNGPAKTVPIESSGVAYGLQPRSLTEADGKPARLEAGDQLRLALFTTNVNGDEVVPDKMCMVIVKLSEVPSIAPPPAVYSLVTATANFSRVDIALHASAPLPNRIDYPNLAKDLARGFVRRQALFIWSWSSIESLAALATLIKVDRSGGAQIPASSGDFISLPA